jgi:thiol-disulfide isomerase/thioredoxin
MHTFACLLVLLGSLLQQSPSTPDQTAWTSASALKSKGRLREAAAAFEAFPGAYPSSPRAVEALVEAGVCWFTFGRSAQVLHRATPQSSEAFDRALALFDRVTREHPKDAAASRAQYMKGSTRLFDGKLKDAEQAYAAVLDAYSADAGYVAKSLERRAFVRRHLLDSAGAIADLELFLKSYAKPDTLESAKQNLALARTLEKPAIAWTAEAWVQGEPATLESFAGQTLGIYFFATWCPHCAEELPFVLDLAQRYAPQGLALVGVVNHSKGQTVDSVKAYLVEKQIAFPVLMDPGVTMSSYGAPTIPHLVLVDREGKLRWRDNPSNLADWTIDTLLGVQRKSDAKPAGGN